MNNTSNIEDTDKGKQHGPNPTPVTAPRSQAPSLLQGQLNDHGNASRLIAMYGDILRYCHAMKKWLVWDGMRWAIDDTEQAKHLAKQTLLEMLRQAVFADDSRSRNFACESLNARNITAMFATAQSEIAVRPEELDRDPWALNFINGTVDLRTGLRPHDRADLITKLVHYTYDPAAGCCRWEAFLDYIMGGDSDPDRAKRMVEYLQRALGYSLTGVTTEKVVFIPFGPTDSGKTAMLSTVSELIQEYAASIQVETLITRAETNNTLADLADLRGARFAHTSETEQGQSLAQGKLKRITQGGGKIKSKRLYENPIEFVEMHKLWVDTNRRPHIPDTDDNATLNRLHPIPFLVTIPKDQIDRKLPAKLLREAEGILAWLVAGAFKWYTSGLGKPAEIEQAKNEWRAEADELGQFVTERCVTGDGVSCLSQPLFDAYKRYSKDCGTKYPLNSREFKSRLAARGITDRHTERGALYQGIDLRLTGVPRFSLDPKYAVDRNDEVLRLTADGC